MSDPLLKQNAVITTEHDETDHGDETDQLVSESLVEEVSIDGMCGVY